MKKSKILAGLLSAILVLSMLLTACGGASVNEVQGVKEKAAEVQKHTKQAETKEVIKGNKTVVYIMEQNIDIRQQERNATIKTLEKNGYIKGKNLNVVEMCYETDVSKVAKFADEINKIKPDAVITGNGNLMYQFLNELSPKLGSTPVITSVAAEMFADTNGIPQKNITGVRTQPKDILKRGLDLLNLISPLNGRKVVFAGAPGLFTEEQVRDALKRSVNGELKDVIISEYFEDYAAAIKKYDNDPEVGWFISGFWASKRKDGASWDVLKTGEWDIKNRKKPDITFYELVVKMGYPVALGVDTVAAAEQTSDIATKALDGEYVKNIPIEDPKKINIVLNTQTAKDDGLTIPVEVLGSASRVYTDYKGTYYDQK